MKVIAYYLSHAIYTSFIDWTNGLNDGDWFFDAMQAIVTFDHRFAFVRFYKAGIRWVAYWWYFSLFLKGQTRCAEEGNKFSSKGDIMHGIPQGSVVFCRFLLLYINNLCNGFFKGNIFSSFVGDTTFFYLSKTFWDLRFCSMMSILSHVMLIAGNMIC